MNAKSDEGPRRRGSLVERSGLKGVFRVSAGISRVNEVVHRVSEGDFRVGEGRRGSLVARSGLEGVFRMSYVVLKVAWKKKFVDRSSLNSVLGRVRAFLGLW